MVSLSKTSEPAWQLFDLENDPGEQTEQNPDGAPRAWISNLTVDPSQRGRGLGRAMLLAGIVIAQRKSRSALSNSDDSQVGATALRT